MKYVIAVDVGSNMGKPAQCGFTNASAFSVASDLIISWLGAIALRANPEDACAVAAITDDPYFVHPFSLPSLDSIKLTKQRLRLRKTPSDERSGDPLVDLIFSLGYEYEFDPLLADMKLYIVTNLTELAERFSESTIPYELVDPTFFEPAFLTFGQDVNEPHRYVLALGGPDSNTGDGSSFEIVKIDLDGFIFCEHRDMIQPVLIDSHGHVGSEVRANSESGLKRDHTDLPLSYGMENVPVSESMAKELRKSVGPQPQVIEVLYFCERIESWRYAPLSAQHVFTPAFEMSRSNEALFDALCMSLSTMRRTMVARCMDTDSEELLIVALNPVKRGALEADRFTWALEMRKLPFSEEYPRLQFRGFDADTSDVDLDRQMSSLVDSLSTDKRDGIDLPIDPYQARLMAYMLDSIAPTLFQLYPDFQSSTSM